MHAYGIDAAKRCGYAASCIPARTAVRYLSTRILFDLNAQLAHSLAGLRQPSLRIRLGLKARNAQAALESREPTASRPAIATWIKFARPVHREITREALVNSMDAETDPVCDGVQKLRAGIVLENRDGSVRKSSGLPTGLALAAQFGIVVVDSPSGRQVSLHIKRGSEGEIRRRDGNTPLQPDSGRRSSEPRTNRLQ